MTRRHRAADMEMAARARTPGEVARNVQGNASGEQGSGATPESADGTQVPGSIWQRSFPVMATDKAPVGARKRTALAAAQKRESRNENM